MNTNTRQQATSQARPEKTQVLRGSGQQIVKPNIGNLAKAGAFNNAVAKGGMSIVSAYNALEQADTDDILTGSSASAAAGASAAGNSRSNSAKGSAKGGNNSKPAPVLPQKKAIVPKQFNIGPL